MLRLRQMGPHPGKICYFVGIEDKKGDELTAELSERMVVPDPE